MTEGITQQAEVGPRRQRVIELFQQGVSVRQIAAEMDISVQRVYQHVWAARKKGLLPPREEAV
jgi:DNA-binding NarL/FixJ family response regulator